MLHGDTQLYIILRQIGSEYRPVHLKAHQNLKMLAKLKELLPTIFQKLKPNILVFFGGGMVGG